MIKYYSPGAVIIFIIISDIVQYRYNWGECNPGAV